MALIEMVVSLELKQAGCVPEVRAWLDLDPQRGLESEVELPLAKRGMQWRGVFAVDPRRCEHFAYRLGIAAHAEAVWSLSFGQRKRDFELLADSDRLVIAKCWLVGSCRVRRQLRAPTAKAAERVGPPKLRLVPGGSPKPLAPGAAVARVTVR